MTDTASGPRIAPLRPPFAPDAETLLSRMTVPVGQEDDPVFKDFAQRAPAIFATIARDPGLGEVVTHLRTFTHSGCGMLIRERELLAHRITARLGAESEWSMHAAVLGANVGLSEEVLDATVTAVATDPVWVRG